MKKVLLLSIVLVFVLTACGDVYQHKMSLDKARTYFPLTIGAHWVYEIEINKKEMPYDFHLFYNPTPEGLYVTRSGGNYLRNFEPAKGKPYRLELHIARQVTEDLPYDLSEAVEVSIDQDDLGFYRNHHKVYWGLDPENEFLVSEIVTYPVAGEAIALTFSRQGLPVPEEAFTNRILFFNAMVDEGYSLPPADFGIDDFREEYYVEGYVVGEKTVVIAKRVKNQMPQFQMFPQEYQDRLFYAPHKGLFRFEQKRGRKVLMQGRLVKFDQLNQ